MFPWLPEQLRAQDEVRFAATLAEAARRPLAAAVCTEIINATLRKLDALGIGMQELWKTRTVIETPATAAMKRMLVGRAEKERAAVEKLLADIQKNIGTLLRKDIPRAALPAWRRHLLETAFDPNFIARISMEVGDMRRDLVLSLVSIREHLEAVTAPSEPAAIPDEEQSTRPEGPPRISLDTKMNMGDAIAVLFKNIDEKTIGEAAEIEQLSFGDEGWTADELADVLQEQKSIAAVRNERTLGYAVYAEDADEITLTNIVVHPAFRRMRVGEQLITGLKMKMRSLNLQRICAPHIEDAAFADFLREQDFEPDPERPGSFQYFEREWKHQYIGPARINNRIAKYLREDEIEQG